MGCIQIIGHQHWVYMLTLLWELGTVGVTELSGNELLVILPDMLVWWSLEFEKPSPQFWVSSICDGVQSKSTRYPVGVRDLWSSFPVGICDMWKSPVEDCKVSCRCRGWCTRLSLSLYRLVTVYSFKLLQVNIQADEPAVWYFRFELQSLLQSSYFSLLF